MNRPIRPVMPDTRSRQIDDLEACEVLSDCHQCGRRAPQFHLVAGRVYCSRCCPACARLAQLNKPGLK